jgi:hypothetical protein
MTSSAINISLEPRQECIEQTSKNSRTISAQTMLLFENAQGTSTYPEPNTVNNQGLLILPKPNAGWVE